MSKYNRRGQKDNKFSANTGFVSDKSAAKTAVLRTKTGEAVY